MNGKNEQKCCNIVQGSQLAPEKQANKKTPPCENLCKLPILDSTSGIVFMQCVQADSKIISCTGVLLENQVWQN